ncbi:MAG TPA: histidine phosphatase family protein [Steroidobacteraceae bacterium]|jgi:broad specificity phosphatase PhoE|nr:histidine phosphatase family protein [Steroidobacteraceae bacterium]
MSKLILVRHGESHGNRDRIFAINPAELPLTELGYRQASEVADQIELMFKAEVVVASPFLRARETARVIAGRLRLPLEIETDLYERDVGALKGQSYDELERSPGYSTSTPWAWRPEAGESYEDVRARVGPILDRLARAHPTRDVVIVSHGGVMQVLQAYVTGDWRNLHAPPNCGMVIIEHSPEGYSTPQIVGDVCATDAGG